MLFIVTQEPKMKHRASLIVFVMVVEAKTRAEAMRKAASRIATNDAFCKPRVAPLEVGHAYAL